MLKKLFKLCVETLIFVLVVIFPGSTGLTFFKIAAVNPNWWVGLPLIVFGFLLLLWTVIIVTLCLYALLKELD